MNKIKITILTSLYNCAEFLEQYLKATIDVCDESTEIILLHNTPQKEELAIIKKYKTHIDNLNHVLISERETLYASWNRGIKMAKGEFITIWNVDDIRTKQGLIKQKEFLTDNVETGIVTGCFIAVRQYMNKEGNKRYLPELSKSKALRGFYGTPFMMWRKSVHKSIGYFDEQFRSAGDFDFWVRMVKKYPYSNIDYNLGYFLVGENVGISKSGNINNVERTVVEIRYGIFDKIDLFFLFLSLKYNLFKITVNNKELHISECFTNYKFFILSRIPLVFISILKTILYYFPQKMIKYIIFAGRQNLLVAVSKAYNRCTNIQ